MSRLYTFIVKPGTSNWHWHSAGVYTESRGYMDKLSLVVELDSDIDTRNELYSFVCLEVTL